MPIDPRILFQLNAPPDPTESMARAAQLRSMMTSNASSLLDLQQKRKKIQDQENMDAAAQSAYQTPAPVTTQAPSMNLGGVSLPGSTSTVQGPAQFDRAAFLSKLAQTNPLDAVGMQGQFATQDAAQQKAGLDIREQAQKLQKNDLDMALTKIKTANQQIGSVMALPPELRPQGYARAVQGLKQNGLLDPNHPEQYPGDDAIKGELAQGLSAEQIFQQEKDARDHTDTLAQQQQELQSKTVQTAEGVMGYNPKSGKYDQRIGSPTKALQVGAPGASPTDAKDIADAIVSGIQPPTLNGLYRNAAPVRAELARRGFNLAQAESDWKATQRHLSTLNGAQQERLRQAVSFTNESLDVIDNLYDQWKKVGATSGIKVFNRAALATAKQLPGEAGSAATRLEAQINDLTSELGTVYKGGNSSTDESLKLAAGNLAADWNETTFKAALKQIRLNLQIRQNSINNSQVAGASANNPYAPNSQLQPAGGGITVTDPQGGVHTFPDQASADKFKALANIK